MGSTGMRFSSQRVIIGSKNPDRNIADRDKEHILGASKARVEVHGCVIRG